MHADTWEALLPPIFASAGIRAGGALDVEPLTGGVSSDIVRIRLGDGRVADDARSASAVDHRNRLAKLALETDSNDPCGGIGAAACAPRDVQSQRFIRIIRQSWGGDAGQKNGGKQFGLKCHSILPIAHFGIVA